jgi:hypothetical protein
MCLFISFIKRVLFQAGGMAQVVGYLSGKCEALSSNLKSQKIRQNVPFLLVHNYFCSAED